MKSRRTVSAEKLFQAVLSLKNTDECCAFFEDLCTIKELESMAQRLQVAHMLDRGMSYQDISGKTGISSATISRVNNCLVYGNGGYRTVLERSEYGEGIQ
ncbi:MAG: YerC/YecD family TrpR-related protein [Oscillospiraceae bacterium]|nr:YerC/YecD family TrpR-related protein [Oscillospiraceae bacterium]